MACFIVLHVSVICRCHFFIMPCLFSGDFLHFPECLLTIHRKGHDLKTIFTLELDCMFMLSLHWKSLHWVQQELQNLHHKFLWVHLGQGTDWRTLSKSPHWSAWPPSLGTRTTTHFVNGPTGLGCDHRDFPHPLYIQTWQELSARQALLPELLPWATSCTRLNAFRLEADIVEQEDKQMLHNISMHKLDL